MPGLSALGSGEESLPLLGLGVTLADRAGVFFRPVDVIGEGVMGVMGVAGLLVAAGSLLDLAMPRTVGSNLNVIFWEL